MKMRFWQKTYIFTLVIFLICLNIGILSLTLYTYQKNIEAAETAVAAEQYYVAMSFERDYYALTESNENASPALLMQSYGAHYSKKGLFIAFKKGADELYSNFKNQYSVDKGTLIHTDFEEKRHILISAMVCDGEYELIIAKNVESLDSEFRSLMTTYSVTAGSVSLVLAVVLYFVLKKLSGPLEMLRNTTERIETSDFSARVEERGNDEFTLVAKSFNLMLDKINEQMEALESEAEAKILEAERKQMLVDNMAHELRTPLTSIHGYAEYLEKANTTEERRLIAAKYIISESERLQKISEILLDGAFIRENEIEMSDIDLGAVLRTYSYFSLTAFGYANFGPFITAILTCALLALAVIYLFKPRKGLKTAILNVSGFATVASLMPLMFGFDYITVIGVIITLLLAGTFGTCFIKEK